MEHPPPPLPWQNIEEIDYHYHNCILSALSDGLYDINYKTKNAKELWDALNVEYGLDDAGINRFNVVHLL